MKQLALVLITTLFFSSMAFGEEPSKDRNDWTAYAGEVVFSLGDSTITVFEVACDGSDRCITRSELRNLLSKSLEYVLFQEGVLNSMNPAEDMAIKLLNAINCLKLTDSACKILK